MPKVNLPPGCAQLKFADGDPRPVRATRPGGSVVVSDERARMIDSMTGNGEGGLVHAAFREYGDSTRSPGRVCTRCGFKAYAWSLTCPRSSCGAGTVPE